MGGSGGGLDEEFEDSLGDFDEAVSGGTAGGGGSEEEIDILDPMGGGGGGAPSNEPLFEEGELGEDGDTGENQSVAQRAASGSQSDSSSSSGSEGGSEGGASGQDSGSQQSQSQSSQSGSGGGGAGAKEGDPNSNVATTGGAQQGGEDGIVPIPEDVGDGRNDDIVLRQIRAAAMNEQDPVLREKLWDEYRRIKSSR
jgi:hypothetical protein